MVIKFCVDISNLAVGWPFQWNEFKNIFIRSFSYIIHMSVHFFNTYGVAIIIFYQGTLWITVFKRRNTKANKWCFVLLVINQIYTSDTKLVCSCFFVLKQFRDKSTNDYRGNQNHVQQNWFHRYFGEKHNTLAIKWLMLIPASMV